MAYYGSEKRRRCLQVLELLPEATEDQIKRAYKSMALRYHPDKNSSPDANVKFQEISAAYNYLMEGDDYLRRIEHENHDLFDIIFRNLFSWVFNPQPSYAGAFNLSDLYYDDDDDDEQEDYADTFYGRNFSYTFEQSRRPESSTRPQSSHMHGHNPSSSHGSHNRSSTPSDFDVHSHHRMYGHNSSSSHGFNHPSTSSSDFSSDRHYTFAHANVQHGQYFHETKQARQNGRSAKKLNKDARMARKENRRANSGESHRSGSATSPSERQASSQPRHNQKFPTHSETQNPEQAKEANPFVGDDPIKTENQSTKKSKKQIKIEQKQREQEMSEIRQQLQEQEEKKKRQSEERKIAQELKEKAEREAKEEEIRKEDERIRIEQEAVRQKMEKEKREKAKKAVEDKKRKELLWKFESNPFLNEDGSFQSNDSDLMNIIRTETYSAASPEDSENVESINGILVSDLARLQMSKENNEALKEKDTKNGSPNKTKTRARQRSRSRQARKNAARSELTSAPSQMTKEFIPNSEFVSSNQANFQPQLQQQQPFHQWSQNTRQPFPHIARPYIRQPHLRPPVHIGPTVAPSLPPPQLNRPPPPLRFNYRPCFQRQPSSNLSATRFPNQSYRTNAM